jgi:hypothetical protein
LRSWRGSARRGPLGDWTPGERTIRAAPTKHARTQDSAARPRAHILAHAKGRDPALDPDPRFLDPGYADFRVLALPVREGVSPLGVAQLLSGEGPGPSLSRVFGRGFHKGRISPICRAFVSAGVYRKEYESIALWAPRPFPDPSGTSVGVGLVSTGATHARQLYLLSRDTGLPMREEGVDPRGLEPLASAMRGRRSPD